MGWVEKQRARQAAEAAAAKAATNGKPEPPEPATRSTESDENYRGNGPAYVEAGYRKQLALFRATPPGKRNTSLYVSAKALARLGVDRKQLRRDLLEVAEENGLLRDDGEPQCLKTIRSGYRRADIEGPREYTADYIDQCNVEEVPLAAFDLVLDDDDDDDEQPEPARNAAKPQSAPAEAPGIASVSPIGSASSAKAAGAKAQRDKQGEKLKAAIFTLEGDFWERDSLSAIYDSALMRMTPPWSVLAGCVARVLLLVPAQVRLPALIGAKTSLNWFGAPTSPSGGGKSSAIAVAAEMIKGSQIDALVRAIGSGEGIAAQYRPPGRNPQDHNELMFVCEEIDTLTAMKERSSSTVTAVLNNAFMGDPIGHSYKNNVNIRPMVKDDYRLTLIVGAQPGRAASLLDDRYSGLLQRFQWFPAFDPRIKRKLARPGVLLNPLSTPALGDWDASNRDLTMPPEVVEAVQAEHEKRGQGDLDALDGHMMLIREKFAFGLCVLDNRQEVSSEDWRLAGIAIEVSLATRKWVEYECRLAEDDVARRKGRPIGMVQAAATDAKVEIGLAREQRIGRWLVDKLESGPLTDGALHKAQPARDRPHRAEVLDKLARDLPGLRPAYIERCKNAKGLTCWQLTAAGAAYAAKRP